MIIVTNCTLTQTCKEVKRPKVKDAKLANAVERTYFVNDISLPYVTLFNVQVHYVSSMRSVNRP